MKRYIRKRLLQLIPVLLGITLLSFLFMNASSADAVDRKESQVGGVMAEEEKQLLREEMGLDRPLPEQYIRWLGNALRGDLGTSFVSGESVADAFRQKLPATVLLTFTSILLTILVSVPLGILAAVQKDRLIDQVIRLFGFLGNSMPNFLVSLLLIYVFSLKLKWFPVMGTAAGWKSVILPTLTLGIAMASKYTRQVRAAVLEELNQDYVIGARARGVREHRILLFSVLKSSFLTILTLLGLSIGNLLGGTAIVESIFMWDGVGKMAVDAIAMGDYPVIQAYVIWMSLIYVGINLLTDLLYQLLDPRIRIGGQA